MSFSFIQITHHHLGDSEQSLFHGYNPAYALTAVLNHIAQNVEQPFDFIVSTGDLVENPTEASYSYFQKVFGIEAKAPQPPGPLVLSAQALENVPLYVLPGNHDDCALIYRMLFADRPETNLMNVHFDHKGTQFICLDAGPAAKGVFHDETLHFLDQALKQEMPAVLLLHHHLNELGSRWMDQLITEKLAEFASVIRGQSILAILHGHTHFTYEQEFAGIPVFGLRSTSYSFVLQNEPLPCLTPPHYRVVTIDGPELQTKIFEVDLEKR